MVGWQESHPVCKKNPVPLIPRGSLVEQVEKEDPRGKQLTQIYVEKTSIKWK